MSLELKDQYDKIYTYCYFRVKNATLAEDITQETFLKFFSQHSYISRGKPLAYLYTIAKNLCIDSYRKSEPLPLEENDIFQEDELGELETKSALQDAINTLSEDLQEIILLRYANDLAMTEISKITGLSRFSIYRKINSAIDKLKLELREEDFYE